MTTVILIVKAAAVLAAAALLGNWFLAEVKRAKANGLPWYAPYLTPPGLLIIAAILLPLFWLAIR